VQKRGLGRGLESLIPNLNQGSDAPLIIDDEPGDRIKNIAVSKIVPNPNQPRKHFDEDAFGELLESVKQHGLIQPIVVRPMGTLYEIVVGERRWRAAKEAGLKQIPTVVRNTTDVEAIELAIIENVQRQDLNALEEAAAFYHLLEDFGFTQEQLAKRIGKKRSTVANTVRLLRLPLAVKEMVVDGRLSAGHARAILSLPSEELQTKLAERVVNDGLTVRQTETLARLWQTPAHKRESQPMLPHYNKLAKDLSQKLEAKVRVKVKGDRGRVEIHFKSDEELKRILAAIDIGVVGEFLDAQSL